MYFDMRKDMIRMRYIVNTIINIMNTNTHLQNILFSYKIDTYF